MINKLTKFKNFKYLLIPMFGGYYLPLINKKINYKLEKGDLIINTFKFTKNSIMLYGFIRLLNKPSVGKVVLLTGTQLISMAVSEELKDKYYEFPY